MVGPKSKFQNVKQMKKMHKTLEGRTKEKKKNPSKQHIMDTVFSNENKTLDGGKSIENISPTKENHNPFSYPHPQHPNILYPSSTSLTNLPIHQPCLNPPTPYLSHPNSSTPNSLNFSLSSQQPSLLHSYTPAIHYPGYLDNLTPSYTNSHISSHSQQHATLHHQPPSILKLPLSPSQPFTPSHTSTYYPPTFNHLQICPTTSVHSKPNHHTFPSLPYSLSPLYPTIPNIIPSSTHSHNPPAMITPNPGNNNHLQSL